MPRCLWCDALNPNYGKAPSFQKKKKNVKKREIFDDESFEDGTVF